MLLSLHVNKYLLNNNNNNYNNYYCFCYLSLSPLSSVFTIAYMKQIIFLGYLVQQIILYLKFVLHVMLFPPLNVFHFCISTFRSMCAVHNMAVFCSSLISCSPGMLLTYSLSDFKMVPVASIFTGITFAFTFHMRSISIVMSSYFRIFSAPYLITFLSPDSAPSVNMHVPFLLLQIMTTVILVGIILLVCNCWFRNIIAYVWVFC